VINLGSTGGTYFDTVLSSEGEVLFNGTPEETKAWLIEKGQESGHEKAQTVIIGESLKVVYISKYLGG
jgi:hypothetical protein